MLAAGITKKTFYCPSTSPQYDDNLDYLNPTPHSLWFFQNGVDTPTAGNFNIIGYAMAFSGPLSKLFVTNQNSTINNETITMTSGDTLMVSTSDRILMADCIISQNNTPDNPGSFSDIAGGFWKHHVSAHLKGTSPTGGNAGFKDGHVIWRKFQGMQERATGTSIGFWW
jgi:hypothetical protein